MTRGYLNKSVLKCSSHDDTAGTAGKGLYSDGLDRIRFTVATISASSACASDHALHASKFLLRAENHRGSKRGILHKWHGPACSASRASGHLPCTLYVAAPSWLHHAALVPTFIDHSAKLLCEDIEVMGVDIGIDAFKGK